MPDITSGASCDTNKLVKAGGGGDFYGWLGKKIESM